MADDGVQTFLEVGPGSTLTKLVSSILAAPERAERGSSWDAFALDSSQGKKSGVLDLAQALARLAARGHAVELTSWQFDANRPIEIAPAKPGFVVPICGANYVSPKAKKNRDLGKLKPVAKQPDNSRPVAPQPVEMSRPVAPQPVEMSRPVAPQPVEMSRPVAPQPVEMSRPVAPQPVEMSRPVAPQPVEMSRPVAPQPVEMSRPVAPQPVEMSRPVAPQPVEMSPSSTVKVHARKDCFFNHRIRSSTRSAESSTSGDSTKPRRVSAVARANGSASSSIPGKPGSGATHVANAGRAATRAFDRRRDEARCRVPRLGDRCRPRRSERRPERSKRRRSVETAILTPTANTIPLR